MQKEFWHDKWQADQIGFHLESAHPLLQKFYRQVFANNNTVFVPLCGKSKDLIFLSKQGFRVIGNELSEKAVSAFYTENYQLDEAQVAQLNQSKNTADSNTPSLKLLEYSFDGVSIYQGDFFQLQVEQLDNAGAIYDRAALIALPETMRLEYVTHLKKLFKSANLLLITLEYEQERMSGPPFSVSQKEVNALFNHAQIELLYSKDIIEKEPRFKSKGLNSFIENAYQITW
jgi:thiopurine S-methyltransferase